MKRSQDKIKDYVEPQAFDEVRDFAADPARALAAYRFTDATSDLLARWLDALADLPAGQGAARALAGMRGVGKSHLLATFGALVAAPELRPRVADAHVAVSAKRLMGRGYTVVRVERGTRPTLGEELRAGCLAAFKRETAAWPEDPVALLTTAAERASGTLVLLVDTAYGREHRVERDDGPLLSQFAATAARVGAFVALALDDDIAGADGINVALAQSYQIDYLEAEHLYRIVDLYLLRKQAQARAALHELYLTLRHTIPNFNWSEQRFAALYPVHPLVADAAASVRLYAPGFAFLPFAVTTTLQALNRPALSLILLDEVFDRSEEELRKAKDLQEAFTAYDVLSAQGVAEFPAMQRLQVRLVLKLLFVLSLDGRGASARDLCSALLFHDETAPQAGVKRIEATLQKLAAHTPGGLKTSDEQGEAHYRFPIGASDEFDAALAAACTRTPADDAALYELLRGCARARFSDWPFTDDADGACELHANWRGTPRRGRIIRQDRDAPSVTPAAADGDEWELIARAPGAPSDAQTDESKPAWTEPTDAARAPFSFVWQPAGLTPDETHTLRRLLALRTDPALGAFLEPALAAHAALTAQAERIWSRLYLDEGVVVCAGARLPLRESAQSAPTLAALVAALLDAPLAVRYPQHPNFAAGLDEADCARLVECMFGTVAEADTQREIEQLALPLGLACTRADSYTLECGAATDAPPWCQATLAMAERAGEAGVGFAELQQVLGGAPFGLAPAAQRLVVAALVAQRRLELVTAAGERRGRGHFIGAPEWAAVIGIVRASAAHWDAEELTTWARRLTGDDSLASVADSTGRDAVRAALATWLANWRAAALVARCEQMPDAGLTLRAWQLTKALRRTFAVAAEACAAALADVIPLEEGLQRVADAFGRSPSHFAESAGARDKLAVYLASLDAREHVRAYLAGAEPTGVEEIECVRRELLLLADDAHSLFAQASSARFEMLWQVFRARYAEHYADLHERTVGPQADRAALAEVLGGDAWREFESLAGLPFISGHYRAEADALVAGLRHARCDLDVRALLAMQPTCVCAFRLTHAEELVAAPVRLTAAVTRGRTAVRRTLAHFHQHLAHSLNLLARERSSAARAGRLAEAFARGETPLLLTRADVRLVARAFEISPPPEPLRVPPPDLNHGAVSRAELHARLADWLADLPPSHTLVEVAAKMGSDAA